jgi:hypothetical protein
MKTKSLKREIEQRPRVKRMIEELETNQTVPQTFGQSAYIPPNSNEKPRRSPKAE